ncbi:hypothetical protein SAMN05444395_102188 [Flavobacterium fryxellicola]|uniref:Uncharacterized protein n=1 Tax=Flavobacterium fryxellicola TaxID=249352 RepID=A0A167Y5H5_9FLAO|nr:hypothetical protein [Flavobacterium fryxellicola]OAB29051.1 hypothetical protein FBFR_06275 [Flavobacterium fryxellicola]SHN58858.1 hypothetical protein SAMN05444395_102188 [Flavobacterium fryxellicola]
MKNIYLNAGTINEVFTEIKTSFNGVLNKNNNEFKLTLNTDLVKGEIDGITFINGITSVQVSLTFLDDITLSIESFSNSSIVFAYCNEGHFRHSYGISGPQSTFWEQHAAIATGNRSVNSILYFKKNHPVQFSIIKVETLSIAPNLNDSLLSNLKKTFINKQPNFTYHGIQNFRIAEKWNQLKAITEQGMVGHILKKDLVQSIVLLEIDDNTNTLHKMTCAIKRSALHKVKETKKIYNFIKQYSFDVLYNKVINSKSRLFIK